MLTSKQRSEFRAQANTLETTLMVGKGIRARRAVAKKQREQRNEYFRQQAIEKSIEKARERQLRSEE